MNIYTELNRSFENKEITLFCGAGISRNSGLPTVFEFENYVLEKLGIGSIDKNTILNSELPFEAFMETMQKGGLNSFYKLLNIYAKGKPTANHTFLAKMMTAGKIKTIVTTNFDTLIEQALKEENWQIGNHYELYYKEEEFANIDFEDDTKCRLIKIHGSVHDKDSLIITLKKVAGVHFSEKRKCIVDNIFSYGLHKKVLILGYSCSDLFDISPYIEMITSSLKQITIVDHSSEEKLQPIESQEKKNPFKQFKGSYRLFFNTDQLIENLWCKLLDYNEFKLEKAETAWREDIDYWVSNQTEIKNISFISSLLGDISEFTKALNYSEKALTMSRGRMEEGRALYNLACLYKSTGDYTQAISLYQESLQYKDDNKLNMFIMNALGSSYQSIGNYQKAINYYNQAHIITQIINDSEQQAVTLNNLGAIHNTISSYNESITYCQEALQIAIIIGDKQTEGVALNNLSDSYRAQNNYTEAIDCSKKSLKISRDIGNKWQEVLALSNMGNIYHAMGDNNKAIHIANEALPIAKSIGDKASESGIYNNLGAAYGNLKEYHKAIKYYELCLQLVQYVGNKFTEGVVLNNLGTNYFCIESYSTAAEKHLMSYNIFSEILPKNHPYIAMAKKYYNYAKDEIKS